jgi:hypothetical protein
MDDNKNNLKVDSISLSELLSMDLTIPEYQRPYVWTKREIEKLLNQFKEHVYRDLSIEQKPNFYLGSIVLHNDGENLNIIDGQQRITTLQLLDLIKNKNQNNYNVKYSHPITLNNIKNNYDYFNVCNDFMLLDYKNINVTIIETDNEDLAYNFFETLNTGGIRLGGTDILKAHHLRSIKDNDERNYYALNWEKNQKNLEKVNRMLSKIRRMDYLRKHGFIPNKFTDDHIWKTVLTEDFAEKVKKDSRDIGYSFVEIEENTHSITADKYAIRQPLNEGINYINYLLSFAKDYNFLFNIAENTNKKYTIFNTQVIDVIDGTIDLRYYYQLLLLCFVDRFGKKNILEFSLYLFRVIYSLRLGEKTRIYEATVINFVEEKKIMEWILNAYTYDEIINYLNGLDVKIYSKDISGVRERFLLRINNFFKGAINIDNYDSDLKLAIENYLNI